MPRDAATILRTSPTRFRAPVARGAGRVDPTGGRFGAGIIRDVAIVTRGEALGHGLWIDRAFLRQVKAAVNETAPAGVKARFTHPGLSSDGLGRFLGRFHDAKIKADVVRGDLHLARSAHDTPDGDLAAYVMGLAQEDPKAFGESISFYRDVEAEDDFLLEHGAAAVESDDDAEPDHIDTAGFESPDEQNTENYPHARLAELCACDSVDEPAANPGGLFYREQEIAQEADALASYALGLSAEAPELVTLSVDAERVAGFVSRFLESNNLELVPMTKPTKAPTDDKALAANATDPEPVEDLATAATPTDAEPVEELAAAAAETPTEPAEPEPAEALAATDARAECARFLEAFGDAGGKWYAEGLSFEDAQAKHVAQLNARLADAERRLAAVDRGETEPADFQAEESDEQKAAAQAAGIVGDKLAPLAAKNAAAMARGRN